MTNTPEQMRALAEDVLKRVAADRDGDLDFADRIMTALRTAADQLEAVQVVCDRVLSVKLMASTTSDAAAAAVASAVRSTILTADTAPQGGRDD